MSIATNIRPTYLNWKAKKKKNNLMILKQMNKNLLPWHALMHTINNLLKLDLSHVMYWIWPHISM